MSEDRKQVSVDFEKALTELETLVDAMERGELSLEDSLKHYERGVELGRACQRALDSAEQRIRVLGESSSGEATLEPFEPESEDERA